MMRKKINYINITPIPSYIPRQLAIDILHSHGEVIQLNPLVLDFNPIKAPRDAPADEFYSTWYDITQRIQYVPGAGKLGSGKINFNGCFHDMPWGLQTHIYAPAGVDLRNKWQICGNQPGEPPEQREMGIGAPPEGLYLREDIEIKCNFTMVSFVKKETKAASKILVERLIKKAELLDAGVLTAMMEDGKLKTLNPADRTSTMPMGAPMSPQPSAAAPMSPGMPYQLPRSPTNRYRPGTGDSYQPPGSPAFAPAQMAHPHHSQQMPPQTSQNVVMELPGDYYYAQQSQDSKHLQAPDRYSHASELSGNSPNSIDGRWSSAASDYSSRPTSYTSDHGSMRSPGIDQKGFAAELPTMNETHEEHDGSEAALKKLEGGHHEPVPDSRYPQDRKQNYQPYNPQDYAPPQYQEYQRR